MPEQPIYPPITSKTDLGFARTLIDGKYDHHSFWYLTPDDKVWHGTLRKTAELDHPTLDEVIQNLKHIEDAEIWPEKPDSIKSVPVPTPDDVYVKRPCFTSIEDEDWGPSFAATQMLHEATILESIPPHPNVVTYLGCRVHRGRITGIVLESIEQQLEKPSDVSNVAAFLHELQSAVDHIHALGLAHNDIKPQNIMIKDGHPILIDFGSCRPPGTRVRLATAGSPGWFDESISGPAKEHDIYAMNKLREWFQKGDVKEEAVV